MNSLVVLTSVCYALLAADVAPTLSAGMRDADGVLTHTISSPYQPGELRLRVLPPKDLKPGEKLPVVYVLPVEAGKETKYGDGLREVVRQNLNTAHRAVFVAPDFAQLPWYADHPTDNDVRQESYFLQAVLPLVEKTYPTIAEPWGRLLLGFSKSGWGAWTLLLRHPEVFGRAAAWDAPLTTMRFGKFGSGPIFGTGENSAKVDVVQLLRERGKSLGREPRLILLGKGGFADDTAATHVLLDSLAIPHVYRDGPLRKHDWHSGWVREAVELLLTPAGESQAVPQ
jgi:S-formylglutathione hydrolase FrmB